jgi:CO/xanthine dehydrogenase Mo-binding subunit
MDVGLVINPDGAVNQVEGGAIQSTGWVLKAQVRFDQYSVSSDTWETCPILRFSEVPAVEVELLAPPPGTSPMCWPPPPNGASFQPPRSAGPRAGNRTKF